MKTRFDKTGDVIRWGSQALNSSTPLYMKPLIQPPAPIIPMVSVAASDSEISHYIIRLSKAVESGMSARTAMEQITAPVGTTIGQQSAIMIGLEHLEAERELTEPIQFVATEDDGTQQLSQANVIDDWHIKTL